MTIGDRGLSLIETILAIVAAMFFCILGAKNTFNRKQAEVLREQVVSMRQALTDCEVENSNLKILLNHGRKAE